VIERAPDGQTDSGVDLGVERHRRRLERVVWGVTTLVLVAAATGLFGRGPLARAHAGARGGPAWVEYERFARFHTPAAMAVHLGPDMTSRGQARVTITGNMVERLPVERVVPQPVAVAAEGDGATYTFDVSAAADSATLRFVLEPGRPGSARATVAVAGAPPLTFTQFVYP
jgi:hypothetical protein